VLRLAILSSLGLFLLQAFSCVRAVGSGNKSPRGVWFSGVFLKTCCHLSCLKIFGFFSCVPPLAACPDSFCQLCYFRLQSDLKTLFKLTIRSSVLHLCIHLGISPPAPSKNRFRFQPVRAPAFLASRHIKIFSWFFRLCSYMTAPSSRKSPFRHFPPPLSCFVRLPDACLLI